MTETEFIKHLRAEKFNAQESRSKYTLQKLSYATVLLGVGSLNVDILQIGALGPINLGFLLYLVPWVALAFDLYIMGEDYSVKRFGAFLGANSPDGLERHWERWVSRNRDPFAPTAMPILNMLLLLGAAIMIWLGSAAVGIVFWIWLVVTTSLNWALFVYYRWLRKHVLSTAASLGTETVQPSRHPQRLRAEVQKARHTLNSRTYQQARQLFDACTSDLRVLKNVQQLASEYGKPEFLLCVNGDGEPMYAAERVLEDFRETLGHHPNFGLWFQEARIDNKSVLLAARWLCHLVGLRHRAVHLFLDHPTADEYTLVQVRGLDKAEAPGRFDLPAAGHVMGADTIDDTLFKELEEELGLTKDDVSALQELGSYEYPGAMDDPGFRNVEYRRVYKAQLKPDAMAKVQFVDHEVAAISIFSLSEIQSLIDSFPERVASGLEGSFPTYIEHKTEPKQAQTIPSIEEGEIQ